MSHCFAVTLPQNAVHLASCLMGGQVFRWKQLEQGLWCGVVGAEWYEIRESSSGSAQVLEVRSNAGETAFRRLLRLDQGDEAAASVCRIAPELGALFRKWRGLRVLRQPDAEETLFCFLCTANNHVARITGMIERLAEHGVPFEERPTFRKFPKAEAIEEIGEERLRALGFGYRAKSLVACARALGDRPNGWLEGLRSTGYAAAHQALCELPGVGPKLADCVALFGLDLQEAAPIDVHIWRAMTRWCFPEWQGASLTPSRYKEAGSRFRELFGDLSGYVQQFLYFEELSMSKTRVLGPR